MIRPMSFLQLLEPLSAKVRGEDVTFSSLTTDTRKVSEGDCFVALKGERFDGHEFVKAAQEAGAKAAVVEAFVDGVSVPQLQVSDTTAALGQLGHINRLAYQGPLIGLTGSCGKTTVKEMLIAIAQYLGKVHATQGNLNNHIGVPLTLLAIPPCCDCAIIEMGASGLGEVDYLASLAEPTVALVNNVMAAHLEGFGSKDGIAKEKSSLYFRLRQGGTAVVNFDEPYSQQWLQALHQQRNDIEYKTFSVGNTQADVFASHVRMAENGCYSFDVCVQSMNGGEQEKAELPLPLLGKQNIANALAAITCAMAAGVSLQQAATALKAMLPVNGRLVSKQGLRNALVIDDTYNANPGSVKAAANVLCDLANNFESTWLVLGDMAELGADEETLLTDLGADLAHLPLGNLLTVGHNSQWVSQTFAASAKTFSGVSQHFETKELLLNFLQQQLNDKTAVLVKGSRSARMEQVVQAITSGGEQQ